MIRLTPSQITVDAAAAEGLPSRSISGVAVTYDETATVSDGTQVRFLQGSLPVTGRDPKLYMQHDSNQIVGKVVERVDTAEGMLFTAKISATRLGDEALTLANDGVIDAVSVGVTPTKFSYDEEGVMIVESANWSELSLVSEGAFAGAVITDVAASAPDEVAEGIPETELTNAIQSDQDKEKDTTPMSETQATPVVEAAQATVDKLWAQPKREFRMPSVGEYLAAYHIGGDTFRKVNEEFVGAQKAKQSVLEAAAGDIATTDTPGLLPVPVLGPVFQDINFIRPFVTAIGARAYPDGGTQKTFIRPTITTHTSVAEQTGAVEFGAASATTMVIAANSVTKKTFAGQVTLSVQDIDFTSPAAMTQIMNDLMGQYMIATDNFAVDAQVSGSTTIGQWDGTPEDLILFLYGAARDISNGSNLFPTHLLLGADAWAKLGSTVDADKRPLFPMVGVPGLGGYNTLGAGNVTNWSTTNPLGLQIIVDSNVAAKTMIVFHAPASEYYEAIRGLLSVENPGTLSRTFSYYGYASFFQAKATLAQKITYA
jgi:HK97 family phage prohead protease